MRVNVKEVLHDEALNTMNLLNEIVMRYPRAVSFAPGRPMEAFFDVERSFAEAVTYVEHVAAEKGVDRTSAFNDLGQYGKTNGIIADLLVRHLALDENIHTEAEAIMVTCGCQEAMTILLMGLFDPARDVLLVSDPTYVGMTGPAQILGIPVEPVKTREGRLEMARLRKVLAGVRARGKNPKALYHIPDFNNPLGASMPVADRRQLLALAEEEDLLIFEDNPYGMFAYDGDPLPTIKSMDKKGLVVYLGTFAKTLYPGLRVGYMVADQRVKDAQTSGRSDGREPFLAQELSKVKSYTSVNTSQILQAMIGGILLEAELSLKESIRPKVRFYKQNRDQMLRCLELFRQREGLSQEQVRWNKPAGGFFLSINLPFEFDRRYLDLCADRYGVICCPMSLFSLTEGHERQIRLSFSYVNPSQIETGIDRLMRFIGDVVHGREAGSSAANPTGGAAS